MPSVVQPSINLLLQKCARLHLWACVCVYIRFSVYVYRMGGYHEAAYGNECFTAETSACVNGALVHAQACVCKWQV